MSEFMQALRDDSESGPDALRAVFPCPKCGNGPVRWTVQISWRNYPDGSLLDVECQWCGWGDTINMDDKEHAL